MNRLTQDLLKQARFDPAPAPEIMTALWSGIKARKKQRKLLNWSIGASSIAALIAGGSAALMPQYFAVRESSNVLGYYDPHTTPVLVYKLLIILFALFLTADLACVYKRWQS